MSNVFELLSLEKGNTVKDAPKKDAVINKSYESLGRRVDCGSVGEVISNNNYNFNKLIHEGPSINCGINTTVDMLLKIDNNHNEFIDLWEREELKNNNQRYLHIFRLINNNTYINAVIRPNDSDIPCSYVNLDDYRAENVEFSGIGEYLKAKLPKGVSIDTYLLVKLDKNGDVEEIIL